MQRREFMKAIGMGIVAFKARGVIDVANTAAEREDELFAGAQERIRTHRMKEVTITLKDEGGKCIANADVQWEQVHHEFLFGCNIFRWGRLQNGQLEEAYRERFATLLNYATLPFYWASYERERGKPLYEYTDRVVEWCREHGITCKGHPLVWDYADPPWLPDEFDEIAKLSHQLVRDIVSRYKGRIDIWDVVNEPTHLGRFGTKLGKWAMVLGAVKYTAQHLKIARQANPNATLLVNDYRTDPAYYAILSQLKDEGGNWLLNVVGIQSHMHGGVWSNARIWDVCERFARLGLPLHFTETTILSGKRLQGRRWGPTTPDGERRQAEEVVRFYTMLFSHPAVQAITWWDFSDNGAWQGAPAGWLRKDMSPKPAYERLMELIKGEWWTRAKLHSDSNGQFTIRAVYGRHQLLIRTPDGRKVIREVTITRDQPDALDVVL
ncbi:MAG TPA: hypothetical protein EYP10_09915 [Armatimonadetes bacterium]|nr:hypothetical protein [Armatimonadota bacterium]